MGHREANFSQMEKRAVESMSGDLIESPDHYTAGGIEYETIGQEIGKLVAEKNKAYGDSFNKSGDFLKILYPDGIQPEQYADMLGVVRVFDKLMRVANRKDAFGENPWKDVAGYGILRSDTNEK
jgi:hypothetical protein